MAVAELLKKANQAKVALVGLDTETKNRILLSMAEQLEADKEIIIEANKKDIEQGKAGNLGSALLDRLDISGARFEAMVKGVREIVELPDPVGRQLSLVERPNGITIEKVAVPIGVVAMVFESRPNVTADAASLCFKSSNAVILRGGKEAINTNLAIEKSLVSGGQKAGLPEGAIQLVPDTDRALVGELVQADGQLDLVIPRGGEGLIRAVSEQATVPVLKHYKGVCHVYVDAEAKQDMALEIIANAKISRPGVCNAVETVLVDERIAADFLPKLVGALPGVEVRADERAKGIVSDFKKAESSDWDEEYLDLILALKVVDGVEGAISHINQYGSRHTDAIITENAKSAKKFMLEVDTASCMHNASTRFSDGSVFGLGAEIGISTDKLHARGPMGLEELCTYKFLVRGEGQIRQ